MKIRSWLFLALALAVAAACIRLGFWQLSRLDQRRARNQQIRAGLQAAPVDLNQLATGDVVEPYRRVRAKGRFDSAHEIVLTARTYQGQSGVHLVTPLRLQDVEAAVLVDRGWLPLEARTPERLERYEIESAVEIQGIALPAQQQARLPLLPPPPTGTTAEPRLQWAALDVEAISAQIPYELLPLYVALSEPIPAATDAPRPDPGVELSDGPHLGYAIQWFSFALIALLGGGYWTWRRTTESD